MTPTPRHLLAALCFALLLAGCGGDTSAERSATTTSLRSRSEGLTRVVAFTRPCAPVVRSAPPAGRYAVLTSVGGLCPRARAYVLGLAAELTSFASHWNCTGEVRAGYCVDGAFTRGFSWDVQPATSP